MKSLLGTSPLTSIIGFLAAGLTAAQNLLTDGSHPTLIQIISAVLIAIFGRVAAQTSK